MVGGGCEDSGGDRFSENFGNFFGPRDMGPNARNIGVTVLNDLSGTVEVGYWSLPDPSPQPGGEAFYEEVDLSAGRMTVLSVAFRMRSDREDVESLSFKRQNLHGSIDVAASNPEVLVSQVNDWRTVSLTNLEGNDGTPSFPWTNDPGSL
jgi:hypothetical protein